jgi:hypothetical protein
MQDTPLPVTVEFEENIDPQVAKDVALMWFYTPEEVTI